MSRKAQFADLVEIARSLQNARLDGDEIVGLYFIEDVDCLDRLEACLSEQERSGVLSSLEIDDIGLNMTADIRITHPAIGFGLFASSLDSLLRYPKARAIEPRHYLIWEPFYSNTDAIIPDIVQRYRSMLLLIEILARSAAYFDQDTPTLLFISKGKFELPLDYSEKEIGGGFKLQVHHGERRRRHRRGLGS